MAISDTLSDAAEEIRKQMLLCPEAYGEVAADIEAVLEAMDRLRQKLDTPPERSAAEADITTPTGDKPMRYVFKLKPYDAAPGYTDDPAELVRRAADTMADAKTIASRGIYAARAFVLHRRSDDPSYFDRRPGALAHLASNALACARALVADGRPAYVIPPNDRDPPLLMIATLEADASAGPLPHMPAVHVQPDFVVLDVDQCAPKGRASEPV